ncbi:chaperone protein dnaJ 20, chloroplastic [Hevea brasiliensis]|uniref:chaperone protein dnaJ 20, chloroplastic n=1 Tax=Hevea brasiliensis TaxID=3981 RepID=UPI002600F759|nr:chaperone protein dnaJ 20, chloroplastic [Hevea brasiliensis]
MNHGIISAGTQASLHICKSPNISATKSMFDPSSHLTFTTHFPESSFSLKTHSKSVRASPIKAAVADSVYVNPETVSFYDLLGISESVPLSEIKKAYKQLARKYHPDVSPQEHTEEYTKRFIEVQEAYETLSDPKRRALYDRGLHMALFAGKQFHYNKVREGRGDWKEQWESQLTELERERNCNEELRENMSWGARMRRQRSERYN